MKPARGMLAGVLALIVGVGIGGLFALRRSGERVTGTARAEATPVGSFAFAVDDCASGHAFVPGFFGVDLRGAGGFDLRVADSGDEARLWLYPQGAKSGALTISKADCTRWDVLVDWAHVTVKSVNTVSGHVHVTCRAGAGHLTADADFVRCAF